MTNTATGATLATNDVTLKHGDLFETSWGYDQTNYDFLMVLSVSKTGKTAKCQMVCPKQIGVSGQEDLLKPTYEAYGDVFNMRIQTGWKGQLQLRGSYPFCNHGLIKDSRLDTFSRVEPDRSYRQTNPMFGH